MLNSVKIVKKRSTIESKMSVSSGIRTHVLRVTVEIKQNLIPVLNNIDVIFTKKFLNYTTF